jgi:ribosomal protein S18 acetylase RimI-like enzyme
MHDSSALLMRCGHDVEKIFGQSPRASVHVNDHGWLGLTGERGSADLNMAAVIRSAPTSLVEDYVRTIRDLGLDAILIVDVDAPDLVAAAEGLGLQAVGAVPVMVWENQPVPMSSSGYTVRVATKDDIPVICCLVASAFSLDEDMVKRALPASVLDAGAEIWLVEDGDEPLGTGTFVPTDDHVGVYSMATPERSQRRGVGRAVLDTAIAHYVKQGAKTFTLEATEAGFHLYEQVGFVTAATPTVFVIGASTQFPG